MAFNIVLVEPEIPNNTGNIGRLALATGCTLHLVKPFGFEITDKRLKRSGLDYWQYLNVVYYDNIEAFFLKHPNAKMVFLSSHAKQLHWNITYERDLFLVFGKESVGLDKVILETHKNNIFRIDMYAEHIRSLNLANAVSITVYEGLRQIHHNL